MLAILSLVMGCNAPFRPKLAGVISTELPEDCPEIIMEADAWLLTQLGLKDHVGTLLDYRISGDIDEEVSNPREITFVKSYRADYAGYTTSTSYSESKKIHAGKIEIRLCYQMLVVHELGHLFGLDHNEEDPDNLMFPVVGGQQINDEQRSILTRNILWNMPQ